MQVITIIGYLGRNQEVRNDSKGNTFTTFSVAVNEGKGPVTWYSVAAFNGLGKICAEYLTEGRQVLVRGALKCGLYQDNQKRIHVGLDIRANHVEFLGGGNKDKDKDKDKAQPATENAEETELSYM